MVPGKREARLATAMLVVGLVTTGCGPRPPSGTTSPPFTPTAPTPALPTAPPIPTMTADDVKVSEIIKDTLAHVIELAGMTRTDPLQALKDLHSYADQQLTTIEIYTASSCTERAVTLFNQGMNGILAGSEVAIEAIQGGTPLPSEGLQQVAEGTGSLASAVASLRDSLC
jgi:hypothetical protein